MELKQVIENLGNHLSPYSIFLYGSKATNSDNRNSDYEIGVIFEDDKYVSRQVIADLINDKNYAIFSFRLTEIMNYSIDTPFQKNIYMNALIQGGSKTLYGNPVLENLEAPKITKEDLLADINFNLGIALSSVRVFKVGNLELANDMFYKSCFYATRDLIYFHLNKLCLSYNEIYEVSKQIDIPDQYREILEIAFSLRNLKEVEVPSGIYFKNISYINKFVINELK